jgi:hypothetical protein
MKHEIKPVIVPDSFIPQNEEQDIAVMGPLFALFDQEYHIIENHIEIGISDHINFLNLATEAFYHHINCPEKMNALDESWHTLARWRYRNDSTYTHFMLWFRLSKKHQQELERVHEQYAEVKAKVDALDRVFSTELYKHSSGTIYQLLLVGNTTATKADYPVSAVYMNIQNREVFIRPYQDFKAKFEPI